MPRIVIPPFRTVAPAKDVATFLPAEVSPAPWDPLGPTVISGSVAADPTALKEQAGLHPGAPMVAVLEAWCDQTYWSRTTCVPLENDVVELEVVAPPGSIAHEIRHRRYIALGEDAPLGNPRSATRAGSIVCTDAPERVVLQGEGGQFPATATPFAENGLPADARWMVQFDHDSFEEPVLGTVQLLLNSDSPAVALLQSMDEEGAAARAVVGAELRRYVVGACVRAAVATSDYPTDTEWPEHSVGALVDNILARYLNGRSIAELRMLRETDHEFFEALLQGAVADV